jgi:hypothetical protein
MRYQFTCPVILCIHANFTVEAAVEVMKILIEYGHMGHAVGDCRLGWFRDGSDGAVLLLRFLLKVGPSLLKRHEIIVVWPRASLVWSFSPAWEVVQPFLSLYYLKVVAYISGTKIVLFVLQMIRNNDLVFSVSLLIQAFNSNNGKNHLETIYSL